MSFFTYLVQQKIKLYWHTVHRKDKNNKKRKVCEELSSRVAFSSRLRCCPLFLSFFKVFVRFQGFFCVLFKGQFVLFDCLHVIVCPPCTTCPRKHCECMTRSPPTIARVPTLVDHEFLSRRGARYSSLALEFSSRGEIVGRFSPVALWDALRVATVWRRTRTSRQSLSLLLHSLEAAEELSEVLCWHDGWLLFSVPTELLSEWMIHRTSQHSVSDWVCRFSDSPWSKVVYQGQREMSRGKKRYTHKLAIMTNTNLHTFSFFCLLLLSCFEPRNK